MNDILVLAPSILAVAAILGFAGALIALSRERARAAELARQHDRRPEAPEQFAHRGSGPESSAVR